MQNKYEAEDKQRELSLYRSLYSSISWTMDKPRKPCPESSITIAAEQQPQSIVVCRLQPKNST